MHYTKFKYKVRSGQCNLCKQNKPYTWDHVPPKGGISTLKRLEARSTYNLYTDGRNAQRQEIQNGAKYRTICKQCNDLLGSDYDPVMNKFALDLANVSKSDLYIPNPISIETQPNKLVRAVLAHLVAAKVGAPSSFDDLVSKFFFNHKVPIPEDISVFFGTTHMILLLFLEISLFLIRRILSSAKH